MHSVFTSEELRTHLNHFKELLTHFDYSAIKNVRFFNLESLVTYMDTIPQNPFTLQYYSLQKQLDLLEPYLPFTSSSRAKEFLNALSEQSSEEEITQLKAIYSEKIREDFLFTTNRFTTQKEWENLFKACENIRLRKEESILLVDQ